VPLASGIDRQYQTFWPRFWAGLVDTVVFLPVSLLDYWLDQNLHSPVLLALWLVTNTLSFEIYSVAMHAGYGQTLGKMALRVKVLDITEHKLSLRQALLRDCFPILLGLLVIFDDVPEVLAGVSRYNDPDIGIWTEVAMYGSLIWFAVELLTMLTNRKRRALHDFIAGSVVVRTGLVSAPAESDATVG
jgi:uncharacterized RDD family membrane protein YckC